MAYRQSIHPLRGAINIGGQAGPRVGLSFDRDLSLRNFSISVLVGVVTCLLCLFIDVLPAVRAYLQYSPFGHVSTWRDVIDYLLYCLLELRPIDVLLRRLYMDSDTYPDERPDIQQLIKKSHPGATPFFLLHVQYRP